MDAPGQIDPVWQRSGQIKFFHRRINGDFESTGLLMLVGMVMYISVFKAEVGSKLRPKSSFQVKSFSSIYAAMCFSYLHFFVQAKSGFVGNLKHEQIVWKVSIEFRCFFLFRKRFFCLGQNFFARVPKFITIDRSILIEHQEKSLRDWLRTAGRRDEETGRNYKTSLLNASEISFFSQFYRQAAWHTHNCTWDRRTHTHYWAETS